MRAAPWVALAVLFSLAAPARARADEPAPPAKSERSGTLQLAGAIGGVAGAASLLTGVVFAGLALDRSSAVHDHCDLRGACDDLGLRALDQSKTFGTVGTITITAGVGLVLTGVVLTLLGDSSQRTQRTAARSPF